MSPEVIDEENEESAARSRELDPALFADMRTTLFAEFGARALYPRLARSMPDRQLVEVLERCAADEREQVERLIRLLRELGVDPPTRSRRRALLAWLLAGAAQCGMRHLALRLCHTASEHLARGYFAYAGYLGARGRRDAARTCEEFAARKLRHARMLEAWVRS